MAGPDVAAPGTTASPVPLSQERHTEQRATESDTRKDRLEILAKLPVQLVYETGPDLFKKASQALVRLCPDVCFIRCAPG